jgi:hypothetical protein
MTLSATSQRAGLMPAEARGHVRKLPSGKWQLRYYDAKGGHRSGGAFSTKSDAWAHYRDVVEPELRGRPAARRDLTFSGLVDVFLERHAIVAKPSHDHGAPLASDAVGGEVRRHPTRRARRDGGRDRRLRRNDPRATPLPAHGSVPPGARGWHSIRLHDAEPGKACRAEPDAHASRDSRLHGRRAQRSWPNSARSRRLR